MRASRGLRVYNARPEDEVTARVPSVDDALRARLDALRAATDVEARLRADPLAFARRYPDPRDAEIAGLVAACLAFGRVDLFRPVLARLFEAADARGGPRAWVERFDPERDGEPVRPLVYRWNRGPDFVLLAATLQGVIARHGGLEPLFDGWHPDHGDVRVILGAAIAELRAEALRQARRCGLRATSFAELPRGFRYFLPSPADGSACKRWNMYLRWMVRPADGVDLGLWRSIPPSALVMPLDTHVARISRFLGLTSRKDDSWKTAAEITAALKRLDPQDPVRFDFAISHLGISGGCKGRYSAEVCPSCPLFSLCTVGSAGL
jgi:uncharacterized protein (TIGR02757 family)